MKTSFAPRLITIYLLTALLLSALLRFAADPLTQGILHILFAMMLLLSLNHFEIRSCFSLPFVLILLLAASLVSFLGNPDRAAMRNEFFNLFDASVAAYVASIIPREHRDRILLFPVLIGVWLSVILMVHALRFPSDIFYSSLSFLTVNPAIVAGYLLMSFALSLRYWHFKDRRLRVLTVIILAGIILTKSRSTLFLTALTGYGFMAACMPRNRRIALLAGVPLFAGLLALDTYLRGSAGHALAARLVWWHSAIAMFLNNPFNGVGSGNYPLFYLMYRPSLSLNTAYAHNIILQILAETGVFGGIAFIVFTSFVLIRFLRETATTALSPERLPLYLGWGGALAVNLSDYSLFLPAPRILFFVLTGFLLAKEGKLRNRPFIPKVPFSILMFLTVGVLAMPVVARGYYWRGQHLFHSERTEAALMSITKAHRLDPLSCVYDRALAELNFTAYRETRDTQLLSRAIAFQRDSVRLCYPDARSWSDLAWLYWVSGDRNQALESIRTALIYDRFNSGYAATLALFSPPAEEIRGK